MSSNICRLCLSFTASCYKALASIEEKYFLLILPEIDINLVESPMICGSCIALLQTTYTFRKNCIQTEKILKEYASNSGENNLLLSNVLQNHPEVLFNKDVKVESDNNNLGCDLDLVVGDTRDLQCPESDIKLCEEEIMQENQADTSFICRNCGKSFSDRKLLIEHVKTHYEQPHCITCDKTFSNRYGLKRHLSKTHKNQMSDENDEKLYTMYPDKEKLNDYLKLYDNCKNTPDSHTEEQFASLYKCNICQKTYPIEKFLIDHTKTHFTRYNCKHCGKVYYNVGVLKRHLVEIHKIEIGDEVALRDQIIVLIDESLVENALKTYGNLTLYNKLEDTPKEGKSLKQPFEKQQQCNICEKGAYDKKGLRAHIRRHFTKADCNLCGKRYLHIPTLKHHLRSLHKKATNWREETTLIIDNSALMKALVEHNVSTDKDEVVLEQTWNKNEELFKCNLCRKAYRAKSTLQHHIRRHFTNPNCKLCGKVYFDIASVKRHLVGMHQIDVSDDITWRSNMTVKILESEMREELKRVSDVPDSESPKYTCKTCGKELGNKWSLGKHKLIHVGKKTSICEHCNKGFLTKERLRSHIHSYHLGMRSKCTNTERNFVCDICGFRAKLRETLVRHNRRHTGERPYECDICHKSFRYKGSLGTHKATVHSTERLFTCEYCSKSFNFNGSLTKHIQHVHMGDKIEKNFVCCYCGKKYQLRSQLNSHVVWHKSDRPFSCDLCEKRFVNKQSLRKHRIIHFPEKKHTCEICGKGFHYKYNIKVHMKVHGIVS